MTCHPSHQKQAAPDPRAIKRQHRWKFGHDPHDDDATPESDWVYAHLEQETQHIPDQRHLLKGGPESGMPCPKCQEIMRVAGSMTAKEILEQDEVEVVNKDLMNEADWERLSKDVICVLVCPKCQHKMQMREEFLPRKRQM